jgi:hypothetical protein
MATAICHTSGCGNAEHPIDVTTSWEDFDTGDTVYVSSVVCGVCGQSIDDVDPPLPDPAPEPDPAGTESW